MASARHRLGSSYARMMFDQEGVLATWFPDRQLAVGDIVSRTRETGALTVEDRLSDLVGHLPPLTTRPGSPSMSLQRGTSITVQEHGRLAVTSAELTSSKASSFVFSALNGTNLEYDHLAPVRQAILALDAQDQWQERWQLVTEVRRFSACTIIIARQAGTTARLAFEGVPTPLGLGAVASSTEVSVSSGDFAKWELRDATPLYEGLVVTYGAWTGQSSTSGGFLEPSSEETTSAERRAVRAGAHPLDLPGDLSEFENLGPASGGVVPRAQRSQHR